MHQPAQVEPCAPNHYGHSPPLHQNQFQYGMMERNSMDADHMVRQERMCNIAASMQKCIPSKVKLGLFDLQDNLQ